MSPDGRRVAFSGDLALPQYATFGLHLLTLQGGLSFLSRRRRRGPRSPWVGRATGKRSFTTRWGRCTSTTWTLE
jgi:hypothetical protein